MKLKEKVNCYNCGENINLYFDNHWQCSDCECFFCELCAVDGKEIITCTDCGKDFCSNCFSFHCGYVKARREFREKVEELKKSFLAFEDVPELDNIDELSIVDDVERWKETGYAKIVEGIKPEDFILIPKSKWEEVFEKSQRK